MKLLVVLLFCFSSVFSQQPKINVKISSISSNEVNSKNKKYFINYEISNTSNAEISFFLIPNALIANAASSATLFTIYKIYQNGVFEDMDGPFFEFGSDDLVDLASLEDKNSEEYKSLLDKIIKSQKDKIDAIIIKYSIDKEDKEALKKAYRKEILLTNSITLNPYETKKFTITTIWNKNRFVKNDDLEFYLDENKKIEIELLLVLNKTIYKEDLDKLTFDKIANDSNFIEGTFKSNKMEIIFDD